MRKIIYVLVVVSIAIVNTVFTIRNSDEIVDLVSLKSEAFANNDEISGGALGPLHKFGCGIPEKVIVAYDSDNNPILLRLFVKGNWESVRVKQEVVLHILALDVGRSNF